MVTLPHHYAFCKHMLLEITKQMHAHTEGGGDAAFVHRVCQKPQKNERFLELLSQCLNTFSPLRNQYMAL